MQKTQQIERYFFQPVSGAAWKGPNAPSNDGWKEISQKAFEAIVVGRPYFY